MIFFLLPAGLITVFWLQPQRIIPTSQLVVWSLSPAQTISPLVFSRCKWFGVTASSLHFSPPLNVIILLKVLQSRSFGHFWSQQKFRSLQDLCSSENIIRPPLNKSNDDFGIIGTFEFFLSLVKSSISSLLF